MRWWKLAGLLGLVFALSSGAVSGVGSAASPAPARTALTIAAWPEGVFGYVSGSDAARCARDRTVTVFDKPAAGPARRVAVVRAERNQLGYIWMASVPLRKGMYAVEGAQHGCAVARSHTLAVTTQAEPPKCGTSEAAQAGKCIIVLRMVMVIGGCPTFTAASDACKGWTDPGVNPGWDSDGFPHSRFAWGPGSGSRRDVKYWANDPRTGFLAGTLSHQAQADFQVENACGYTSPGPANLYRTADQPGAQPGSDTGPLYLNFDPAATKLGSTHVTIWGTLYRTGTAASCQA
jgi:hypothetical protein